MDDAERVDELLILWEEAREEGRTVTFVDLCRDYPELLPELRRRAKQFAVFDKFIDPDKTHSLAPTEPEEDTLTIPGHEVLHRLGRGGMANVYASRNLTLERTQAVKVIRPGLLSTATGVSRFHREMKLLAKLDHPNIIPIYEAQIHKGRAYFVMPLVPGGSLSDNLERFHGDPTATARLIEQVARGVHHAHEQGILHRDLKPANILLGSNNRPLVSDFGIATVLESETEPLEHDAEETPNDLVRGTRITHTGQRVGTVPYMAPEQACGDLKAIGPWTDVWALGVILYRLLTREMPFGIEPPDWVVFQIQNETPKSLDVLVPEIDPKLVAIVERCLQKKPGERYSSAAALADDLAEYLRPPERRWSAWRVGVGLALLGFLIGVVALMPSTQPEDPPAEIAPPTFAEEVQPLLKSIERGHAMTLVGDARRPPMHRVAFGSGRVLRPEPGENENTFRLAASEMTLLELLPSMPVENFRIEAELVFHRTRQNAPEPMVGIYLGHTEYVCPDDQGTQHLALSLLYCDARPSDFFPQMRADPGDMTGGAFVTQLFYGQAPDKPLRFSRWYPWKQRFVIDHVTPPCPPRRLALEFKDGHILASFEGWPPETTPFAVMPPKSLASWEASANRAFSRWFPELRKMPFEIPATGGIGISAQDAAVSVRWVRVIPLE